MSEAMDAIFTEYERIIGYWLTRYRKHGGKVMLPLYATGGLRLTKTRIMSIMSAMLRHVAYEGARAERTSNDKILADMMTDSGAYKIGVEDGRVQGAVEENHRIQAMIEQEIQLLVETSADELGIDRYRLLLRRVRRSRDEKEPPDHLRSS